MAETRRTCTPEEKVQILRQRLIENVPISDVWDQHGLNPMAFYQWQKASFENGAAQRDIGCIMPLDKLASHAESLFAGRDAKVASSRKIRRRKNNTIMTPETPSI